MDKLALKPVFTHALLRMHNSVARLQARSCQCGPLRGSHLPHGCRVQRFSSSCVEYGNGGGGRSTRTSPACYPNGPSSIPLGSSTAVTSFGHPPPLRHSAPAYAARCMHTQLTSRLHTTKDHTPSSTPRHPPQSLLARLFDVDDATEPARFVCGGNAVESAYIQHIQAVRSI